MGKRDEAAGENTDDGTDVGGPLPGDVVAEAERLTRLAREATDPGEVDACRRERDDLVADHGYTTRLRDDDDTLVFYPTEWVEDGEVRFDRIDDTARAVEVPLSGTGDDEWETVEAYNAALVEEVRAEHGPVHGANARAFADFLGNHYLARVDEATARHVREFLEEYYPRNAWPSDDQRTAVETSLSLLFEVAGVDVPGYR
jgi:hypothetical protein